MEPITSPLFFPTPEDFRQWLEQYHHSETKLWVGFYKKDSGRFSITWPESVDEALCFGWIDGIRKSINADSYMIRFTPRKPGSIWSAVNIKKIEALTATGKMRPAGIAAFEKRKEEKSKVYAYEREEAAKLTDEEQELFTRNEKAWAYFNRQPTWYKKTALHLIVSAKQNKTRQSRLTQLIKASEGEIPIRSLTRPK